MKRQFRSLPLHEPVERVDRASRVIYGVSCAQAVEALGHGILLDARSIEQIVGLGNGARAGVKSRFTHPGLSSDGLGKFLGRIRNLRKEDDKAVGDLHLSELAFKANAEGGETLGEYVLTMAEQEADLFGFSIVFDGDAVWPLADGTETPVWDEDGHRNKRPDDALTDKPVIRITELAACDLVDEPAANRDGMFATKHLWASNALAAEAFDEIDSYLADLGLSPDKAFAVALKYFNARGVKLGEFTMGKEQETQVGAAQTVDPAQFAEMQKQLDQLQERLAATAAGEAEAKAHAAELEKALDNVNERLAAREAEARRERFRARAAGWAGDTAGHVELLEQLADASGEDSKAFAFYCQQQDAVAEQLRQSNLFGELGHDKRPANGCAYDRIEAEAKRLMAADASLTHAQAIEQAAERNPQLYREYQAEQRGR